MKLSPIFENLILENLNKISLKNAINMAQLSDVEDVGTWLNKDIKEIEFYYKEVPIEWFDSQIAEMESTYDEFPEDLARTEKIFDLIRNGNKPKPIFVNLNDKDRFIMEGRHRIVAFKWLNMKKVPVIYVK